MGMHYVYLILSQNRLIITSVQIDDSDYFQLLNNSGNAVRAMDFCKTFCIGYILGSTSGRKIVNTLYEFA